ncbi:hypothetical protein BDR22DRAFT_976950 [Usnea florida]
MCFLVEKYAPSSKVQYTEETLPNLGAVEKVESFFLTAGTNIDREAAEESKNLGVEPEPSPVTGIAERPENPLLADISGDTDTGLSNLKITPEESAVAKLGSGSDVPSTETPSSALIADVEAEVGPRHVDHASRE